MEDDRTSIGPGYRTTEPPEGADYILELGRALYAALSLETIMVELAQAPLGPEERALRNKEFAGMDFGHLVDAAIEVARTYDKKTDGWGFLPWALDASCLKTARNDLAHGRIVESGLHRHPDLGARSALARYELDDLHSLGLRFDMAYVKGVDFRKELQRRVADRVRS